MNEKRIEENLKIEENSIIEMINALNVAKEKFESHGTLDIEIDYMIEKTIKLKRYIDSWIELQIPQIK